MIVKFLLVCLVACSITTASVLPITKCNLDDSKCMKKTTQDFLPIFAAGIPEFGVETLDPFFMKRLDASSRDLKLVLTDITGTGLSKCLPKKIQFDQAKSKLYVVLECTVDFEGHYEMNGQILVLPIQGNGRAHVVLRKLLISVDVDMAEVTGKDGLPHWSVKSYSHVYELKEKATIELENLFNGNNELGRIAKDLFTTSPNEVVDEVGPPIIKAVVKKIVTVVNHLFKHFALPDLVKY